MDEFSGARGIEAAASAPTFFFRDLFGGEAWGATNPIGLGVMRLSLRWLSPRFLSIHADIAAELILVVGDDETFPLRQLLSVQQLCWTYRYELVGRFAFDLFGSVFAQEFAADRYRRLITGRRFDALLSDEAVSKAFHRSRRWIRYCTIVPSTAKQGRSPRSSPFLQLADTALGDLAYAVNRTDYFLFA